MWYLVNLGLYQKKNVTELISFSCCYAQNSSNLNSIVQKENEFYLYRKTDFILDCLNIH